MGESFLTILWNRSLSFDTQTRGNKRKNKLYCIEIKNFVYQKGLSTACKGSSRERLEIFTDHVPDQRFLSKIDKEL